jgi:hypothetical protein
MTRSVLRMMLIVAGIVLLPSSRSIAQERPHPNRDLLHERSLTKDIPDFSVGEEFNNTFYKAPIIQVSLVGGSFPDASLCERTGVAGQNNVCGQYLANPASFGRHLKDLKIQVWVLKVDGTALTEKSRPGSEGNLTVCNAGDCTDRMNFVFEHIAPSELTAVVIRVDGKLIVREIQATQ